MKNKTHVKEKILASLCVETAHRHFRAPRLKLSLSRKWPVNHQVGAKLPFQVPKDSFANPYLFPAYWLRKTPLSMCRSRMSMGLAVRQA